MNNAQAVDMLGFIPAHLNTVVETDHIGSAVQFFGTYGFQESQAHPLLDRRRAGVDFENGEIGMIAERLENLPVLSGEEQATIVHMNHDGVPVETCLRHQQHSVSGP